MYKRSNFFQNSCFHVKEKLLRNKKSFQNLNFIYNYVYILYVGAYLLVTLIYVVYFTYVHSYYLYMDSSLYFRVIITVTFPHHYIQLLPLNSVTGYGNTYSQVFREKKKVMGVREPQRIFFPEKLWPFMTDPTKKSESYKVWH